ncbi:hypothetical protein FQR65_LT02731 [Abscondita terminalis]|nr:hypothetical protein FQR65_LT02731 [Abscondita terminalis]
MTETATKQDKPSNEQEPARNTVPVSNMNTYVIQPEEGHSYEEVMKSLKNNVVTSGITVNKISRTKGCNPTEDSGRRGAAQEQLQESAKRKHLHSCKS